MNDLQNTVAAIDSIDNIYLNENGEWLFYEHPAFPIVKTREEILAMPPEEDTTVVTKKTK